MDHWTVKGKNNSTVPSVLDPVRRLVSSPHHVFLDNLFTTPELFKVLRQEGNAAFVTARLSSGIWDEVKKSKLLDNVGKA
ncbi:hypothetical protein E4U26_001310 [Claviceps purpurea]|nr:hypothetical protein E4U26_001310 [Claviceps purpurea]